MGAVTAGDEVNAGLAVVNCWFTGHIFCNVCISGLCIYILCELHTSRIVCRIENNRMGQATGSCRRFGKCQVFLYCSFSVELVGALFDSLAAFASFHRLV